MVVLNVSMEHLYLPSPLCSEMLNYIIKFLKDAVYVYTANYIHNRIFHKGIGNQVPFEILYYKKGRLKINFKVFFGCKVFFFVPKQIRKKNLGILLFKGNFLGYDDINYTAFKIFDSLNNKIILSWAVSFLESHLGIGNIASPSSPRDIIYFFWLYWSQGGERIS